MLREDVGQWSLSGARVVHRGSPRVLVVRLEGDADVEHIRQSSAVAYAGRRPPVTVRDNLEPGEQLFVDGWLSRLPPKPERPGDGLAWDAPGMSAPDPPRTPAE